jgi:hypothetical protein
VSTRSAKTSGGGSCLNELLTLDECGYEHAETYVSRGGTWSCAIAVAEAGPSTSTIFPRPIACTGETAGKAVFRILDRIGRMLG